MFDFNTPTLNQSIATTKKIVVGLGCSFTIGTGAWDDSLIEEFPPVYKHNKYGFDYYPLEAKKEIAKRWTDTKLLGEHLQVYEMEQKNAFVSVLANKYLGKKWTPINLATGGAGNFSCISKLLTYPINWQDAEEITVIFCPTGIERYDIIRDTNNPAEFQTIWPACKQLPTPINAFYKLYENIIWSDRFNILNAVVYFNMLKMWCERWNANLIIVPAFSKDVYTHSNFKNQLTKKIVRDSKTQMFVKEEWETDNNILAYAEHQLSTIPWDKFFHPQGFDTFFDLAYGQETTYTPNYELHKFFGAGSPTNWITKCGHPSAKAHDLFAKELYTNFFKE